MANKKLRKPLLLQEEFTAGEVSNPNQNATPAVKTDSQTVGIDKQSTGEKVRAEIVKDVDSILTNLEALSKQITEAADSLIMEEDAIAKIFQQMKSSLAIAKCESKLKKYEEILKLADANMQTAIAQKKELEIQKKAEAKFAKLSGSKLEMAKAAMDKAKAKLDKNTEYEKERNKNVLSEFEAELTEEEADISKDGVLGKLYFRQKQMLKNQVAEQGVLAKAEMAELLGNEATAKALKVKLEGLKKTQLKLAQDIADGKKDGAEDLKELEGVKAYIKEIEAIQKAGVAVKKVREEAEKQANAVVESFYATWASENADLLLEGAVADLFSKAKGANDEAALAQAKSIAGKMKAAADAEYKAKAALVNKIKGKEVPKTIVILAGGDGDSAKEGKNGYTLGEFIPKWGGGTEFVKPEDFGPMKDVAEVEANVDDAIAAAKEANKDKDTDDDTGGGELTDDQKSKIADMEKDISKTQELLSQAQNPEDGSEPDAGKITGLEDTLKKKEDKLKDMKAGKFDPPKVEETEDVEEGNAFGAARAEAIAKGEDKFKVGEEEYPVEDVGADDKENAEEYAEEEGIATEAVTESSAFKMGSIADRFKALM